MSDAPLIKCRCGANPRLAFDAEIAPPAEFWAVLCEDCCGNDTHWQFTLAKASELWNAGHVRNQRGGQA